MKTVWGPNHVKKIPDYLLQILPKSSAETVKVSQHKSNPSEGICETNI